MAKRKPAPIPSLAKLFQRNGYIRRHDPKRRKKEKAGYHKGDEVRFTAESRQELAHIRRLLRQAGFTPGRPFTKGTQYRLPVYGREKVQKLLKLLRVPPRMKPRKLRAKAGTRKTPRGGTAAKRA